MTDITFDPSALQNVSFISNVFLWCIGIVWAILAFFLPFVIWSMRSELRRHTLLMRGIIDELRTNRASSPRPFPTQPPHQ